MFYLEKRDTELTVKHRSYYEISTVKVSCLKTQCIWKTKVMKFFIPLIKNCT